MRVSLRRLSSDVHARLLRCIIQLPNRVTYAWFSKGTWLQATTWLDMSNFRDGLEGAVVGGPVGVVYRCIAASRSMRVAGWTCEQEGRGGPLEKPQFHDHSRHSLRPRTQPSDDQPH
jgi:hypothetical protein